MNPLLHAVAGWWWRYVGVMLWQSSLVMLAVWALYLVCWKRSAALRYGLLCLVLVKLLLPVNLHSIIGAGHWLGVLASRLPQTAAAPAETTAAGAALEEMPPLPAAAAMEALPPGRPAPENFRGFPRAAAPLKAPRPKHILLFAAWLAAASLFGVALVWHALRVRRRFAGAVEVAAADLVNLLEDCMAALDIRRRVRLCVLPGLSSPLLLGMWRPRIVVADAHLARLSREQLRPVILHELAHLKRHDLWVNALQIILQVLWFFHPGLWITNWLIRREREQACDDIVLARTNRQGQAYADSMLAVLKTAPVSSFSTLGLVGIAERGSALRARVARILDGRRRISIRINLAGAAALLAIGAVLLPMAKGERPMAPAAGGSSAPPAETAPSAIAPALGNAAALRQNNAPVTGRCLAETGAPLAGAEVILYYNPFPEGWGEMPKELGYSVVARTTTGVAGDFSFPAALLTYTPAPYQQKRSTCQAGYYLLAKHSDRAVGVAVLKPGQEAVPREIVLYPGVAQKMCTASPGRKDRISGVRVWLHIIRGKKSKVPEWSSEFCLNEDIGWVGATTDEQGECIISNLPPVDCCFFTTKAGYAATWRGGITAPKLPAAWFDVTPGALINGQAVFPDGRPAARLLVKFVIGDNQTWVTYAVTDAQGRFRSPPVRTFEWDRKAWPDLEKLHDGVVEVMADRFLDGDKGVTGETIALQTKEKTRFDNLRLTVREVETVPLHLRLLAPDKAPLAEFKMELTAPIFGKQYYYETIARFVTDGDGAADVVLPPGQVRLSTVYSEKLSGWYMPNNLCFAYLAWTQDRWVMDRERDHRHDLAKIITGKGTRDDPLVLQADLLPAASLRGKVMAQPADLLTNCMLYADYDVQVPAASDGAFVMEGLPDGTNLRVFAMTRDKKFAGLSGVYPTGATNVTVRLKPTIDIPGRCRENQGDIIGPISLTANLLLEDDNWMYGKVLARVQQTIITDADGNFVLSNACPDATYQIYCYPDPKINQGYSSSMVKVVVSNLPANGPFTVEVKQFKHTMRGVVVDTNGAPIRGATVQVLSPGMISPQGMMAGGSLCSTDENGRFEIGHLARGAVEIVIRHPEYKGLKLDGVPTDSVNVHAMLHARGALKVSVQLTGSDGQPVAGANAALLGMLHDPDHIRKITIETSKKALTDTNGGCRFDLAEADLAGELRWMIFCDVPGNYYEVRPVTFYMDSHHAIKLRAITNVLAGTILDSRGKPAPGAKVVMRADISHFQYTLPADLFSTAADAHGRFVFPRISADCRCILEVLADGFAHKLFEMDPRFHTGVGDNDIAVTLYPPCEIAGKVAYAGNAAPAQGIRIIAQGVANRFNIIFATSGENGEYCLRAMEPGPYTIWARDAGHTIDWACLPIEQATAAVGQPLKNQDMILIKGITVSGVIADARSKQPLKDVYMRAHLAHDYSRPGYTAAAKTGNDGRYTLRLPAGGTYTVTAQSNARYESRTVLVGADQPAENVDFALKP